MYMVRSFGTEFPCVAWGFLQQILHVMKMLPNQTVTGLKEFKQSSNLLMSHLLAKKQGRLILSGACGSHKELQAEVDRAELAS